MALGALPSSQALSLATAEWSGWGIAAAISGLADSDVTWER